MGAPRRKRLPQSSGLSAPHGPSEPAPGRHRSLSFEEALTVQRLVEVTHAVNDTRKAVAALPYDPDCASYRAAVLRQLDGLLALLVGPPQVHSGYLDPAFWPLLHGIDEDD